jgi:phosphoglycolate phosphatase-like HAD superfamily hydrolase
MNDPIIYVLDFDGVLCESVMETAITGWHAAGSIWHDMPSEVPQEKIEQFRLVRPIIETGYEAILTMRLLYLDESIADILDGYHDKFKVLIEQANLTVDGLKKLFGATRDAWIEKDVNDWTNMNPLYEGIPAKLQALGKHCPWYIVTTKHERFVKLILQANKVELADDQIYGLDRNMSKPEVIKSLIESHPDDTLYFVEDRLPTLLNIMKIEELKDIKLIFAMWGYNTDKDKVLAAEQGVCLQRLDGFLEC